MPEEAGNGWFVVHRKLLRSDFWTTEPFSRAQAWVDLIGLANFQDGHIRVRGNLVDVPRGSVGWSVVKLATRWKWSRGKAIRFLNELEAEQQIVQHKHAVSTVIAIANYGRYQLDGTADGTADGQQTVQQTDSRRYTKEEEEERKEGKEKKAVGCEQKKTGPLYRGSGRPQVVIDGSVSKRQLDLTESKGLTVRCTGYVLDDENRPIDDRRGRYKDPRGY